MSFDFYVHGLWIVGSVAFIIASMIAGNIAFIEGTTELSYGISIAVSFILFLFGGLCWISAGVNAQKDMR